MEGPSQSHLLLQIFGLTPLIKLYRRLAFLISFIVVPGVTAIAAGFTGTVFSITSQQFQPNDNGNYRKCKNLLGGLIHFVASDQLVGK
jgi:hypothetical protein